jgi:glutaconate CoA-transferase subunit B
MYLHQCYPGVSPQRVAENCGFDLDISRAGQAAPPSDQELKTLREEVDPCRLILGPLPA